MTAPPVVSRVDRPLETTRRCPANLPSRLAPSSLALPIVLIAAMRIEGRRSPVPRALVRGPRWGIRDPSPPIEEGASVDPSWFGGGGLLAPTAQSFAVQASCRALARTPLTGRRRCHATLPLSPAGPWAWQKARTIDSSEANCASCGAVVEDAHDASGKPQFGDRGGGDTDLLGRRRTAKASRPRSRGPLPWRSPCSPRVVPVAARGGGAEGMPWPHGRATWD